MLIDTTFAPAQFLDASQAFLSVGFKANNAFGFSILETFEIALAIVLVFASFNREKAWEYAQLLSDVHVSIKTLHDFEDQPELNETGASLSENATIKARTAAAFLGR